MIKGFAYVLVAAIVGVAIGVSLSVCFPVHADLNQSLPQTWQYSYISTLTTTTPKSTAGTLHSIVVNASGSVPCFVIIYDSATASGKQIASVDCGGKGQLTYDVSFTSGLTIVTSSTATPASAPDITATFQ